MTVEEAFKIAEEKFGILQIFDAVDIDIDKPGEKSVMMYVAEIIKVAEAQIGKSGKVKTDLTDAAIELDRLLTWTAGAEEALKKKKLRKIGDFLKKAEKAVEEVENKLRDWQQLMDLGEFGSKLEQASQQLKDKTNCYVKCGLITPKERENGKFNPCG